MPSNKTTKASQKRLDQAVDAFHSFYSTSHNWDEQRWNGSLFPALTRPTRYCAVLNKFASPTDEKKLLGIDELPPDQMRRIEPTKVGEDHDSVEAQLVCFTVQLPELEQEERASNATKSADTFFQFPPPKKVDFKNTDYSLLSHWNMDAASILPAYVLEVKPGDRVLDLCAAPGGKSIVLAQYLWPWLHGGSTESQRVESQQSCLHSNELDVPRNTRLTANLKSYLPPQLFSDSSVKVLNIDASDKRSVFSLPLGDNGYDKILVDAPCSSERHIIHAWTKAASAGQVADEMVNWKPSHTKTLAKTQSALLMTALKAVRIGGRVVYATCSISNQENDGVIEKALEAVKRERKKETDDKEKRWDIDILAAQIGMELRNMIEPTKHGNIALPDNPAGGCWGPLYFCLLEKIPYLRKTKQKTQDSNREADTGG